MSAGEICEGFVVFMMAIIVGSVLWGLMRHE